MPAGSLTKEQIYGIDRKYLRERFDYCDSGKLIWKKNNQKHLLGREAGTLKPCNRRMVCIKKDGTKKTYKIHRLIWIYHNNSFPEVVDHIDRNTTNNKISNLRASTQSLNCLNKTRGRNNKKYSNVYLEGRKYKARTVFRGKYTNLGKFENEIDAAIAVDNFYFNILDEQEKRFYNPNIKEEWDKKIEADKI
jgi:hypothetical protein